MRIKARVAVVLLVANVAWTFGGFLLLPEGRAYFAGPLVMPDARLGGYSYEDIVELMAVIGPQGRELYLQVQREQDTVIPALGAVGFFFGIWALGENLRVAGQQISSRFAGVAAVLLALPVALLDYWENNLVADFMRSGPGTFDRATIDFASSVTMSKFSYNAFIIALVFVLGYMRWRHCRAAAARVD